MTERLVVVMPCFNEEKNVEDAVREVLTEGSLVPAELVVLMVDDGSSDRTREKLLALAAKDARCKPLLFDRNQGIARAVLAGNGWARDEDWICGHPGDNESIFQWIHSFWEAKDQYDLILGYHANQIFRTPARRLASAAFKTAVNLVYGFSFRYLNGPYLHRGHCFRGLEIESTGYAWTPELLAKALLRNPLLRIGEMPYASRGRKAGESKAFKPRSIGGIL